MLKILFFKLLLAVSLLNSAYGETLFVAHKGVWTDHVYPQNTVESLTRALENGYRGLEFDVMISQDGVPFLAHDDGISRISSNCKGKISQTHSSQLEKCLIHKNTLWAVTQIALKKVKKPAPYVRLDKVLDVLLSDQRTEFIWVDFKIQDTEKTLPVVIELLKKYPKEQLDKILFNNGSVDFLTGLKSAFPELKTSFERSLGAEAPVAQDFYFDQIGTTTDMIGVGVGLAFGHEPIWWLIGRRARLYKKMGSFMNRAKEENVPILFWTIKKDREIKRWIKLKPNYMLLDRTYPPTKELL